MATVSNHNLANITFLVYKGSVLEPESMLWLITRQTTLRLSVKVS